MNYYDKLINTELNSYKQIYSENIIDNTEKNLKSQNYPKKIETNQNFRSVKTSITNTSKNVCEYKTSAPFGEGIVYCNPNKLNDVYDQIKIIKNDISSNSTDDLKSTLNKDVNSYRDVRGYDGKVGNGNYREQLYGNQYKLLEVSNDTNITSQDIKKYGDEIKQLVTNLENDIKQNQESIEYYINLNNGNLAPFQTSRNPWTLLTSRNKLQSLDGTPIGVNEMFNKGSLFKKAAEKKVEEVTQRNSSPVRPQQSRTSTTSSNSSNSNQESRSSMPEVAVRLSDEPQTPTNNQPTNNNENTNNNKQELFNNDNNSKNDISNQPQSEKIPDIIIDKDKKLIDSDKLTNIEEDVLGVKSGKKITKLTDIKGGSGKTINDEKVTESVKKNSTTKLSSSISSIKDIPKKLINIATNGTDIIMDNSKNSFVPPISALVGASTAGIAAKKYMDSKGRLVEKKEETSIFNFNKKEEIKEEKKEKDNKKETKIIKEPEDIKQEIIEEEPFTKNEETEPLSKEDLLNILENNLDIKDKDK